MKIAEFCGRDSLVATRTPICEQDAEVGSVHYAVAVEVARARWGSACCWSPIREQRTEVCAVDNAIKVDVADAFAGVKSAIVVDIGQFATEDLAVVDGAVVVAVDGPFYDVVPDTNVTTTGLHRSTIQPIIPT